MAASAIGGVRFVRCPKCDKLLTEFAQVPIYSCGGCATLLRVKAQHVSIGAQTSRDQPETSTSSEVAKSDHHRVPHNSNGNELQDPHSYSLNEKTEEDDIEPTSLAYDGSVSSGNDQQEAHDTRSSRHKKALSEERDATALGWSDDFRSVENRMGSEIDHDTLSKDLLFDSYSEPDQVKILRKVDELRDELSEFLARTEVPIRNHESGRRRHGRTRAKKQPPVIKQYYRPVCGGAPFVVCYKCWKLLQLPADFLVSGSKTLHKLRCGGCSEILVFSFRPRVLRAPPADEARHRSRSESYSSEPEPEPVHNVSRNSSYTSLVGSRLHRLMGYSSASDILFRSGRAGGGGYESSGTSTPGPRVDRRGDGAGTSAYGGGGGKIP